MILNERILAECVAAGRAVSDHALTRKGGMRQGAVRDPVTYDGATVDSVLTAHGIIMPNSIANGAGKSLYRQYEEETHRRLRGAE